MEYSVKDLVKILLKKWYIILLAVVITVVASYFLSDRSYQQATTNYQTHTTAVMPVQKKTGTLTVGYSMRAKTESANFISTYTNFLIHHNFADPEVVLTMDEIAKFSLESLEPYMESTMTHKDLLAAADIPINDVSYLNQTKVTPPGTGTPPLAKPVEICYLGEGKFHITLTGVSEADGQATLQAYIKELTQILSTPALEYQIDKVSYVFNQDKPVLTPSANLAQLVMNDPAGRSPAQSSSLIKRMCVSGIFSFALACVFILVITFIRDAAATEKKEKTSKEPDNTNNT